MECLITGSLYERDRVISRVLYLLSSRVSVRRDWSSSYRRLFVRCKGIICIVGWHVFRTVKGRISRANTKKGNNRVRYTLLQITIR